jgi:NADH-quinone oxidoreductase subunit E
MPKDIHLGNITKLVKKSIDIHGNGRDALIPVLSDINSTMGYIPSEAIKEICKHIKYAETGYVTSESQLFSMASFYDMLSTQPRGRHVVKFCENAPCHVVGGREVWQALTDFLKLKAGETSPDGKWSLVTTSCLGLCSVGPVILVDDDVFGNVTPSQVQEILGSYA